MMKSTKELEERDRGGIRRGAVMIIWLQNTCCSALPGELEESGRCTNWWWWAFKRCVGVWCLWKFEIKVKLYYYSKIPTVRHQNLSFAFAQVEICQKQYDYSTWVVSVGSTPCELLDPDQSDDGVGRPNAVNLDGSGLGGARNILKGRWKSGRIWLAANAELEIKLQNDGLIEEQFEVW